MKKTPVIAIGLDAADPQIVEKWMAAGHLPNISKIQRQGIYGRLDNTVKYRGVPTEFSVTEPLWVTFATGCKSHITGYWDTVKYDPSRYDIECDMVHSGYDYKQYPPFFALGETHKVAVFDIPVTALSKQVSGVQILGWGGHYPYTESRSNPPNLLPKILDEYGKNPILFNDDGIWWDKKYVKWLRSALNRSIADRASICRKLLRQDTWDLFIAVFGETHTAGHDLYNYSQPDHPLYPHLSKNGTAPDPLLETYQNVDRAVGEILAEAPENAYVLCFSLHGMAANFTDMHSMVFLPEILYRYNFPGKAAIAPAEVGTTPPPVVKNPIRNSWPGEIWVKNYHINPLVRFLKPYIPSQFLHHSENGLASPYPLLKQSIPMAWMPARWYQPLWHQMKAFAMPGFTNGHIRINLKGRDPQGIVLPSNYDSLCDELSQILYRLQDGRTGEPIVKQVIRTRFNPVDIDPKLPDSDLVVLWHANTTDVVDSPDFGRVGPLTHARAGGHRNQGFLVAQGPGITPGSALPSAEVVDLPATILNLINAPIPKYFEGKPLLRTRVKRLD
jgi:predicted AlkP superfamily phosphohydrolase/phosphomutase